MTGKSLAIVGGGLAGLAAAMAATQRGMRVELFEQSKSLGGRASSFYDAEIGSCIDHCRHVAMGCCENFLDFCRRTAIDDCFERSATLHFVGPDGTLHHCTPSRWLPPPLHSLPGLMKLNYLSLRERWGIVQALRKLVGAAQCGRRGEGTVGQWLRAQRQSDRAIERFWSPVVVSALAETVDYASLAAARMVFRNALLAGRGASDLLLSRRPLQDIFHDRVGKWLSGHGATIHLETPVRQILGEGQAARAVALADGTRREFDGVIVAVPWRQVRALFSADLLAAMPALADAGRIEPAAITAVHLWFDRPVTSLPHAVLVGRLSQWVFTGAWGAGGTGATPAPQQYCQVVISASHRLPPRQHDDLLTVVRGELESVWPDAQRARLVHSRVIAQPAAVFSVQPGADCFRPPQRTPIENLALAGDWTATGWPGTMEGAILSGFRAVQAMAS